MESQIGLAELGDFVAAPAVSIADVDGLNRTLSRRDSAALRSPAFVPTVALTQIVQVSLHYERSGDQQQKRLEHRPGAYDGQSSASLRQNRYERQKMMLSGSRKHRRINKEQQTPERSECVVEDGAAMMVASTIVP